MTMDVTFLKSDTFYSPGASNPSLQGETHVEEMNWLTFDWFQDTDTTPNALQPIIEEPDPESTSPEAEVAIFPHSSISNDPSFENIIEVSSPITPHISGTIKANHQTNILWNWRTKDRDIQLPIMFLQRSCPNLSRTL